MKKTLIVGVALALAPAFALAADDAKKTGDKPSSGMSIQSDPLPALDKEEGKAAAQEKASPKKEAGAKKGAAGPAGPAGTPGAAGTTPAPSTDTTSAPKKAD